MTAPTSESEPTPFVIANAFSKNLFGGNPAAIIFLNADLPTETLLNLAKNFNQPIATFITPSPASGSDSEKKTEKSYSVRWFTITGETPICGHGTLAAAGAIFSLGLVPPEVTLLNFESRTGGTLTAKKVGDRVEITLAATQASPVEGEEVERLKGVVQKALGSPPVNVKFIGKGGKGFEHQLVVEIDEKDNLGGRVADTSVFVSYASPFLSSCEPVFRHTRIALRTYRAISTTNLRVSCPWQRFFLYIVSCPIKS